MAADSGAVDLYLCLGCGGMDSGIGPGSTRLGWCYVCVSLDSSCRWQDLVYVLLVLYALFNHPRLLIQVAPVQKAQFSYRLDGLVP